MVSANKQVEQLIQVCYELNNDNMQRELSGLTEAMDELKQKKGLILTLNQSDKIVINDKLIHVIPVWQWLLNHQKG